MERTKLLTVAVIGLLLLNLLTIGSLALKSDQSAYPDRQGRHPAFEGPARIIIERLHFDESQQQQFLETARQHHQQTMRLNDELARRFQAYYGLLTSAQPDSSKAFVGQIAETQRQMAELNFAHFQQIKALCRPDQKADFALLVNDLAHLFGRPQRPARPGADGPPEGQPKNFPPRP